MDFLRQDWAFTRHDVVAHSQGGLLTRMLSSVQANSHLAQPFRSSENFYRGRFHRCITIGSPHNETRWLRYLLALNQNLALKVTNAPNLELSARLPSFGAAFMVFSEIAQKKFDPFGAQIRELNDPSPAALWRPDPSARFHLVRCVVGGGLAPSPTQAAIGEKLLGLNVPGAGTEVIPRGSDGVVDYDSMGAHAPGVSPTPNVYDMPPSLAISHSGPIELFGGDAGETDSADVALHVRRVLDQDPNLPPSARQFGSFPVPALLSDAIREAIDSTARRVGLLTNRIDAIREGGAQLAFDTTVRLRLRLATPPGVTLSGTPNWYAEVFGSEGITSRGLALLPVGPTSSEALLTISEGVFGDVVVYVSFTTSDNKLLLGSPTIVFSRDLTGTTLRSIRVEPDRMILPRGVNGSDSITSAICRWNRRPPTSPR
jgi:hypothetical protein